MTRSQWLSLDLEPSQYIIYDSGMFKTVEAHGKDVIGIKVRPLEAIKLRTTDSIEEAAAIAVILRMMAIGKV